MNCKKCGAPLNENSKFCGICGTVAEDNTQTVNGAPEIFNMNLQPEQATPVQPQAVQNTQNVQPNPNVAPQPMPNPEPIKVEPQPMPNIQGTPVEPQVVPNPVPEPVPSVEPVQPMNAQLEPVKPAEPVNPVPGVTPVQPMNLQPEPVKPVEPVNPVPGVTPIQPMNPQPVNPAQPTQNVTQQPMEQIPNPQAKQLEDLGQLASNMPPMSSSENTYDEPKKKSKLPIILIILILLGVGGFFAYKYFFGNTSEKIVKGLINTVYDKLETTLDTTEKYDIEKQPMLITGDLSVDTNMQGLEDLKNIKLNYTTGVDYKNKKYELGASISENNTELLGGMMYILDNAAYISLKDLYQGLLKINLEQSQYDAVLKVEKNYTTEDLKFITKSYKDILIESLDMNDFKKSSDKITLNGKETKVSKLTYELDGNKLKKLSDNMIDNTLKNQELLSSLAKISNTTVEQLKIELQQTKEETKAESMQIKATLKIYTSGLKNDFSGLDITIEGQNIIEIRNYNNTLTMDIKSAAMPLTYSIKTNSKDSYTISFNAPQQKISGTIDMTSKEIDNNNAEGSFKISVSYDNQTFSANSNYKIKVGGTIADIDTTNYKMITDLTEQEQQEISNKAMQKIQNSKLYDLIMSLSEQTNSQSDI